jgi:hypothetical protein
MTEPSSSTTTPTIHLPKQERTVHKDGDIDHDVQCPICLRCDNDDDEFDTDNDVEEINDDDDDDDDDNAKEDDASMKEYTNDDDVGVDHADHRNNSNQKKEMMKTKKKGSLSLVHGPCRHKFCLPCLKQVFASSYSNTTTTNNNNNNDNHNTTIPDIILSIPTQDDLFHIPIMGRCPICRQTLCLLDLRADSNVVAVGTTSIDTTITTNTSTGGRNNCNRVPVDDLSSEQQRQHQKTHPVDGPLVVPIEVDISTTELAGLTFILKGRDEGDFSIHFPSPSIVTSSASVPHQSQHPQQQQQQFTTADDVVNRDESSSRPTIAATDDDDYDDDGNDGVEHNSDGGLTAEVTSNRHEENLPFLNVSKVSTKQQQKNMFLSGHPWVFDDGRKVDCTKKYFQKESIQYHKESRTFRGTIVWDLVDEIDDIDHSQLKDDDDDEDSDANSVRRSSGNGGRQQEEELQSDQSQSQSQQHRQRQQRKDYTKRLQHCGRWEYMMSFSSDFRYVAKGVIIQHRDVCFQHPSSQFLFDGEWIVSLPSSSTTSKQLMVKVHGNKFVPCIQPLTTTNNGDGTLVATRNFTGCIEYTANDDLMSETTTYTASLIWPDQSNDEIGEPYVSIYSYTKFQLQIQNHTGKGPSNIGERIEWSLPSSSTEEHPTTAIAMVWERERATPDHVPLRVVKLNERDGHTRCFYHRVDAFQEFSVPVYHPETLWGNVFAQAFTVGLASYHFIAPAGLEGVGSAYISYENEATSYWPNLDNGQPIPSRMYFSEIIFGPSTYTFWGKIDWEGVHGTTWNGSRWWRYEITFSSDFSCIGTSEKSERAFFITHLCAYCP